MICFRRIRGIPTRTFGMPWPLASGGDNRPESVAALVRLTSDPDRKVRDWALFSLGSCCTADSAEIREALRMRLTDPHLDARHEALWGLVRRKEKEAMATMVARFRSGFWIRGDELTVTELFGRSWGAAFDVDEAIRLLESERSDSMAV